MNAQDWFWLAFLCFLLLVTVVLQCRDISRKRDNARAIDQERVARENAAPLGNAERFWG